MTEKTDYDRPLDEKPAKIDFDAFRSWSDFRSWVGQILGDIAKPLVLTGLGAFALMSLAMLFLSLPERGQFLFLLGVFYAFLLWHVDNVINGGSASLAEFGVFAAFATAMIVLFGGFIVGGGYLAYSIFG